MAWVAGRDEAEKSVRPGVQAKGLDAVLWAAGSQQGLGERVRHGRSGSGADPGLPALCQSCLEPAGAPTGAGPGDSRGPLPLCQRRGGVAMETSWSPPWAQAREVSWRRPRGCGSQLPPELSRVPSLQSLCWARAEPHRPPVRAPGCPHSPAALGPQCDASAPAIGRASEARPAPSTIRHPETQ